MLQTLEEINKMNGDQIARALELRLITVDDMDKAVLVLDKLKSVRVSKPHITSKCNHLENFIKNHKS